MPPKLFSALPLAFALMYALFLPSIGFSQTTKHPFVVHSYLGQCLSYGPTPGVYVTDCNALHAVIRAGQARRVCPECQKVNQTITVEEINADHEVRLWAGASVIGVTQGALVNGATLELQPAATTSAGIKAQTFALDGDSVLLAGNRALVLKVQNARGANFTPVVLGTRKLNDAEFWDFESTERSEQFPTSGFLSVNNEDGFRNAISNAKNNSVIVIDSHASILLTKANGPDPNHLPDPIAIKHDLVTIRGGRRGFAEPGAELKVCQLTNTPSDCLLNPNVFNIAANYVRVTGLRIKGPSQTKAVFRPKDQGGDVISGLTVSDDFPPPLVGHIVYIDHNELSGWTEGAVQVQMRLANDQSGDTWNCKLHVDRPSANVHVVSNYIHNNQRDGEGYGVVLAHNGYAEITGNTFAENRHAIASDGTASAGYIAQDNWVINTFDDKEQAFDMHGTTYDPHTGGIGGGQVEIRKNSFIRLTDWALQSRGYACAQESFFDNVVVNRSPAASVQWFHPENISSPPCQAELQKPGLVHNSSCGGLTGPPNTPPAWLVLPIAGQFDQPNPTDKLGTGDFDGDGHDDLFLATGAAWYYSPAGTREWRFLGEHSEHLNELLFGDFDGDGRTDVVKKAGLQWFISWGGMSDWELLNNLDTSKDDISQYTVGHFVSPQSTDLFHSNGVAWLISAGGRGAFSQLNTSGYRINDLRFGDFDGDGKTDVFGYEQGHWRITPGGVGPWSTQPLNSEVLSTSVNGLVVGDFDGDGKPDIAQGGRFSSGGRGPWKPLANIDVSQAIAPPGYFSGIPNAQVATFRGNNISVTSILDKGIYEGCCEMK